MSLKGDWRRWGGEEQEVAYKEGEGALEGRLDVKGRLDWG